MERKWGREGEREGDKESGRVSEVLGPKEIKTRAIHHSNKTHH